VCTKLSKMTQL